MNLQSFWSAQVIEDVNAALLAESEWSPEALRADFVAALNYGWSKNTDKPYWTLAWLQAALGHAERISGTHKPYGAFALQAYTDKQIFALISGLGANIAVRSLQGKVIEIETDHGGIKIGQRKLKLLRVLCAFLLFSNEGNNSGKIQDIFAHLTKAELNQNDTIRRHGNAMAAIARKYLEENSFADIPRREIKLILSFHAENGGLFDDDTALRFWLSDHNRERWKYSTSYEKIATFYMACKHAIHGSAFVELFEHLDYMSNADTEETVIPGHDGGVDRADDIIDQLIDCFSTDTAPSATFELPASASDERWNLIIDQLRSAPTKLFSGRQHDQIGPILRAGAFGKSFPRALIRQLVFAPLQSKLSNDRKKPPDERRTLEQRMTAGVEQTYEEVFREVVAIEARFADLRAAAIVRLLPEQFRTQDDERAKSLREQGIVTIASLKPRRGQSAESVNLVAWLELFPIIEAGFSATRQFRLAIERAARDEASVEAMLSTWMAQDREIFSKALAERYVDLAGSGDVGINNEASE